MPAKTIKINRAPVMTLWAAVVAERLGHAPDTALTLGRAVLLWAAALLTMVSQMEPNVWRTPSWQFAALLLAVGLGICVVGLAGWEFIQMQSGDTANPYRQYHGPSSP